PDNKPNNPPNPNPEPSNGNDKPLFPFNPTEPEPHIPPAPPGISEAEAKEKVLNQYHFFGNVARVSEKDIPSFLAQIPYQGDKYPAATFEEIMARNEVLLKQKKLKGFTSISANKGENYNQFSEMREEKQRFLFFTLTPRKSDNTVD